MRDSQSSKATGQSAFDLHFFKNAMKTRSLRGFSNLPTSVKCISISVVSLLIIIIVAIVLIVLNDNTPTSPLTMKPASIGGWSYDAKIDPSSLEEFNWDFIFASIPTPSSSNHDLITSTINGLVDIGAKVHWMTLQDTVYFTDKENGTAKAHTQLTKIGDFIRENDLPVTGIHLDCEPHATDEWKQGNDTVRNAIFQIYRTIIADARVICDTHGLLLTAATSWQYPRYGMEGRLDGARGDELCPADGSGMLHACVPMVYGGTGSTPEVVVERSDLVGESGGSYVAGLGRKEYGSDAAADQAAADVLAMEMGGAYRDQCWGVSIYADKYYTD
eukprot:gnl/Dysnectes_brevis/3453_a4374_354.p2 GENE.gnl/Dysnectes_brevis/3453_a4374_354~~gnl/Dysnectes_brevis/3453_a4374_354.p2  ORF type:complete len:342 (-),score=70.46 gnl/Dysnectes_brevis/3453_a4374_354:2010-3002(-)